MLTRLQFRALTLLGAVALLLVIANGILFTLNRNGQSLLGQRQQFVQQTVPLEGLYREIVKALAEMAVKGDDRQVLDMLAAQGINVSANGPAAPTTEPGSGKNGK